MNNNVVNQDVSEDVGNDLGNEDNIDEIDDDTLKQYCTVPEYSWRY